jgi:head-tail adaptor
MLPAKRLTNLVLIQRKQETGGQWNGAVEWVEDRKVWVSIDPARGREIFADGERQSIVTHTIRGDFLELEGVTEEMRIVFNDTHAYDDGIRADSLVFDVAGVMPNYDGRDDIMIQAVLEPRRYGQIAENAPQ